LDSVRARRGSRSRRPGALAGGRTGQPNVLRSRRLRWREHAPRAVCRDVCGALQECRAGHARPESDRATIVPASAVAAGSRTNAGPIGPDGFLLAQRVAMQPRAFRALTCSALFLLLMGPSAARAQDGFL